LRDEHEFYTCELRQQGRVRFDLVIVIQRQFDLRRALDGGEDGIQRITRPEVGQLLAFAAEGADAKVENIVASVADNDLVGVASVLLPELLSEPARRRIRIQPQLAVNRRAQRL
jgi:hypothetical protein